MASARVQNLFATTFENNAQEFVTNFIGIRALCINTKGYFSIYTGFSTEKAL